MAETVCLRRSFSNPSPTSFDFSQGDPARAVGESVSFGKYMSETLAWEKWSAFTQNRYLEEAEKYSKPGSVAKMKAYFEAHYGRFGARKQAGQEQKIDVSDGVAAQDTPNIAITSTSLALNRETVPTPTVNCYSSIRKSPTKNNHDVDLTCGFPTQLKDRENEEASSVESVAVTDVIDCLPEVQVHQCQEVAVDSSVTACTVENNVEEAKQNNTVSITLERKPSLKVIQNEPEHENPEKEKLDSMSEQKLADCSVKRPKKSNLSKLSSSLSRLTTPVRCIKEANRTANSKVSKISPSLARLATPVHPRKEAHVTLSNRMLVKEPIEKKKLTSNTHLKSINVSSDINLMKKPYPDSRKSGVGNVFTPLVKIIRESFASSSTPSRASINSVSRHPSATPQSEIRRSRVALEKSFDIRRKLDQKLISPSIGNVKSSARSPATFASFNFRTEERAAKRREFFQKRLEKEAEFMQLKDRAKVKRTPDSRKSAQSRDLKDNAVPSIRAEILGDTMKKVPPPCQPPNCKVTAPSGTTQDNSFQPLQRTAGSKPSTKNIKANLSTVMTMNKRHENSSPNIL